MSAADGEVSVGKFPVDVGEHCDQYSVEWEEDLGGHLHNGFYDVPPPPANLLDHRAAAVRMVDEALKFAAISDEELKRPRRAVDVGCGIGGSSRYLSKKYGAHVVGINISTWQVERATALTAAEGLSDKVSFQVADALDQPFPDGHFDLVWAVEIADHLADKEKFMQELVRVAAPGGSIIMTTCCHRDLLEGETSLQPSEQELLDKIGRVVCIPAWCSIADYVRMAQALSLQNIRTADWSENVTPTLALATDKATSASLENASKATTDAFTVHLLLDAYNQELLKYAVFTAQKPA